MRKTCLLMLGLIAVLPAKAPAYAQTLAERELTQREDGKLATELATTNTHCGTALQASIDWAAFLPQHAKLPFATGDCEAALQGIYQMCNSPMAKTAIAQKLKRLSCVHADAKQSLALDDAGTLTLGIDLDGANYNTFVQKWLGDHL